MIWFLMACIFVGDPQPNVVVLLADDLGWADLGCYGSAFHETSNLDLLASNGMRFSQAYSAASLCSPTRASIMTGKHPARVNITDWIPGAGHAGRLLKTPEDIHNLPLSEFTLGEAFADSGYSTFYVGKWHLGSPSHGPDKQGFETYVPTATRTVSDAGKSKRTSIAIPDGDRWHLTRYITEKSIEFFENQTSAQPFFAFIAYHDVHTPVLPDNHFVQHFRTKLRPQSQPPIMEGVGKTRMSQDNPEYASMVAGLDASVGKILRSLESAGLEKNTIVLFASDNGGLSTLQKRLGPACNLPLRAGKGWLYEGGIRIPLIAKFPNRIQAGVTSDAVVTTTDFYPTLLSLAKLPNKPKQHIDATDFSPVLLNNGGAELQRDLFWHFPHYHGSCWTPGSAMRSGNWKLVRFYETEETQLFDLASDPSERQDVSEAEPTIVSKMSKKLTNWQDRIGAALPVKK